MKPLLFILFLSLFGKKPSPCRRRLAAAETKDTLSYRAYRVDSKTQFVIIEPHQSALKALPRPQMITNAGMFDPDFQAHGLLVISRHVYQQLDRRKAKGANFYVEPNGVFYIDDGKYFVSPTRVYATLYAHKVPEFATQSGPMLVINDSINRTFDKASEYLTTRSGVGILPNGDPIFIIAEGINFYDFAAIFKNRLFCKNALFLDGGISEMFVGPEEQKHLHEYKFGPVVAVMKK